MKRYFVMLTVLVMMATMAMVTATAEDIYSESVVYVTNLGRLIDENDDGEGHVIRIYDAGNEETRIEYSEKHKVPNYNIELGGEHVVKVTVNHHPKWVTAVGNGAKWVGNKIKGWFDKDEDCVETEE